MRSKVLAWICNLAVLQPAGCGLSKSTIYPGTVLTPVDEEGMLVLGEVETPRSIFPARDGGRWSGVAVGIIICSSRLYVLRRPW
jgi:hypothetical protein